MPATVDVVPGSLLDAVVQKQGPGREERVVEAGKAMHQDIPRIPRRVDALFALRSANGGTRVAVAAISRRLARTDC
jgi:hypothetical protein